ncbi:MAG: hypothetical protein MI861_06455, partial [Pirellulales bacterium]|nr:hypothetical protein [Pirellulales bacterium]
ADRFIFGVEKTFLDGLVSVETRLPFSSGLDSRQINGVQDTTDTELGNLALAFKGVLLGAERWVLTGGTTLTLPTGNDFQFSSQLSSQTALVENDSVHLAPFLGFLAQPNPRWFAQGFLQADFDLNGNDTLPSGLGFVGVLQDQHLLYADLSLGCWLFQTNRPDRRVQGAALMLELHHTTTLNDTDRVGIITNPFNRMDVLNATGGMVVRFPQATFRVGAAAPLRDDEESLFDSEVIFQFNRFF